MELLSESYHLPIGTTPPYLTIAAQFLRCRRRRFFGYSGAIFGQLKVFFY
jgi:hypothetical protein